MKWFNKKKQVEETRKEETMSRSDFLKVSTLGAITLGLFGKDLLKATVSETVLGAKKITVTDNLTSNVVASHTPPSQTRCTWIDLSEGGVFKYYYGGAWVPVKSVWG